MAITVTKSTKNPTPKSEKEVWKDVKYPCVGVAADGDAVLFSSFRKGIALSIRNPWGDIAYSTDWDMSHFTPAPSTQIFSISNK